MKQFAVATDAKCQLQIEDADSGNIRFCAYKDWPTALTCLQPLKSQRRHIYEMIVFDQPCKPYLDMDGKLDIIPESLKDPRAVMERTQRIITGIVETDYSIRLKHEDFVWSHSKNDVKLSLHLVIATREPQYVYSSNHFKDPGGAKHLATRIMAMDPELGQIVDDGVYTKDRAMRMVNSCKHGKSSMLELVDTHGGEFFFPYIWFEQTTHTSI